MGRGRVFVVSAPSGSGKTTLCRLLLRSVEGLVRSVSVTTRRPRPGERHRRDYFFTAERSFREGVRRGKFLEWAQVFGAYYGTPRAPVMRALTKGWDVLLTLDVEGARQVKKQFRDAVLVFIRPPSFSVLKERLARRRTDHPVEMARRLKEARRETRQIVLYHYAITNRTVARSLQELKAIIVAERNRITA